MVPSQRDAARCEVRSLAAGSLRRGRHDLNVCDKFDVFVIYGRMSAELCTNAGRMSPYTFPSSDGAAKREKKPATGPSFRNQAPPGGAALRSRRDA